MSIPTGAKQISNISYSTLYFLTDQPDNTTICDANNFNMTTGRPLNNIAQNTVVDPFFLSTLKNSLEENVNVHNKFIFDYPKVLDIDLARDIIVNGETQIDAVFLHEGASMKNMFGYYFFIEDGNGNKILLDNADTNTDNSAGYYRPTVIFPHVFSEDGNSDTLQPGNMRTLRGNLASGNFENISIGFFLMPHGWYAKTGTNEYGDDATLYSTLDLCTKYVNTEYEMVNDKIYSVYAKAKAENGDELLFLGFEDIFFRGVYDLDYNDCVVGFNISNVLNIANYDNFSPIVINTDPVKNNLIFMDSEGEYVQFDDTVYNIDNESDYIFERHMIFETSADRNAFYDVLVQLHTHYYYGCEKSGNTTIINKYRFRKNDIKNSQKNGKKKLYLNEVKYSNMMTDVVYEYQNLVGKNLKNENYSEVYVLYKMNVPDVKIISVNDTIDLPIIESGDFRIIGNGVMDTQKGKSHLPFKNTQIYKIYKNVSGFGEGLVINVKMDDHPDGYQIGTKKFVMWVSFNVNNTDKVIVNLDTLDLYNMNEVIDNAQTFTNITISPITTNSEYIKNKIKVFRNDSGATYRTVTINNYLVFYCIRFPNIKNNPTMVYLDSKLFITWIDKFHVKSGTYYNKQTFYPIASFNEY
jgi:hypothetical protein